MNENWRVERSVSTDLCRIGSSMYVGGGTYALWGTPGIKHDSRRLAQLFQISLFVNFIISESILKLQQLQITVTSFSRFLDLLREDTRSKKGFIFI